MDEDKPATIGTIGHAISTWIGICGALFGVLSFCILLGIWFGPIKDMPTQFSNILTQLGEIKSRLDKADWRIDGLQTKYEGMTSQLAKAVADQGLLREDSKRLEVLLAQLNVTAIQKVDFLEWKAELERRNKIDAPQLRKSP